MPAIERLLDGIHALMFVKYDEKPLKAINSLSQIFGSPMKSIGLKEGKARSLLRRHPRIFDGAIAKGGVDAFQRLALARHQGLDSPAKLPVPRVRAHAPAIPLFLF